MKKIMNIFTSEKLEITYDSYEKEYSISLYDKYGHYIDTIKFDKEEIRDLYNSLDKLKNDF
jgi:hypothetical protein